MRSAGQSDVPVAVWRAKPWCLVAGLAGWALSLAVAMAGDSTTTNDILFDTTNGLPRHRGHYATRSLQWQALAGLEGVRTVIPHPEADATVYAIARDGLFRSDDFAATWRRLPLTTPAGYGAITTLAFRPGEPETFCFGTRSNGVWISRDGGLSAKCIGSKAVGMAADGVDTLVFAPDDPMMGTVLAGHGASALGVSRGEIDEGPWTVVAAGYHVFRLYGTEPGKSVLYAFASEAMTPDVMGFYVAPKLTDFWQRVIQDALLTDVAVMRGGRDIAYVTTLDKGLFRVAQEGSVVQELGGVDEEWFSGGVTWGSHGDEEIAYFYQPAKRGLVLTTNGLASATDQSEGLYKGAFTSEGSHIRANVGGTRFYGVINGRLWVGRPANAYCVDTVTVKPASAVIAASVVDGSRWRAFENEIGAFTRAGRVAPQAAAMEVMLRDLNHALPREALVVEAHVVTTGNAPSAVTVDLSRLGYDRDTVLYDRGQGRYAVSLALTAEGLQRSRYEWRATWPGAMPLTVTARGAAGELAGGVGAFSLYTRLENVPFLRDSWALRGYDTKGRVEAVYDMDPTRAAFYRKAVKLTAGPGPWQVAVGYHQFQWNIADFYALTFLIRAQGTADADMKVQLRDNPVYTDPVTTPAVSLVAGGYVTGGRLSTSGFCRVSIPVATLLKGADGFSPDLFNKIVFSGVSAAERTYWIDDILLVTDRKALEKEILLTR